MVSKIGAKSKKLVWPLFGVICFAVFVGCCLATSALNENWRAANEPKVVPTRVELHKDGQDKITRVLISNPSDSWVYSLILLIQVENNAAPIETVQSGLAESAFGEKFDERTQKMIGAWMWGIGIGWTGVDLQYPPDSARVLILYSLAPKENRALWIRGTYPTNSFAKILIVESKKDPMVLGTKEGNIFWPGPHSNSVFWHFFPNAIPMDLDFGIMAQPTNIIHTNFVGSAQMPTKPFRGIPLQ